MPRVSKEAKKFIIDAGTFEEDVETPPVFWCGNALSKKETCCFWHYVFYPYGGPEKLGIYHPMYPYEEEYLEALENNRKVAVFKASKLGVTEFTLLWIIWKCLVDKFFYGKDVIIVTGPNHELAKDLISRGKKIMMDKGIYFTDIGMYGFKLNSVRIKAYPANNISAIRGQPKVAMVFGDEAAFFGQKDDTDVLETCERYIGSDGGWLVFVSTAGKEAEGFFYEIKEDPASSYAKIEIYYERGLEPHPQTNTTIYNPQFIKEAQELRSFEREYCGVWGADTGDIFHKESLEACSAEEYTVREDDRSFDRVIGIDPAFGSSNFGIVAMQKYKGKFTVLYAEDFKRGSFNEMLEQIVKISKRWNIRTLFVDASWSEGIKELRDKYHFTVTGVPFGTTGERMVNFADKKISNGEVRIHPKFKRLLKQLLTIKANKKGLPDKGTKNTFDLGDAFLLAMYYFLQGSGKIIAIQ